MHRAGALAWEDLCWNVCGDAELNVADPCEPSFLAPNPISIRRPPLVRKAMRIDRQTRGTIVVADDDEVTRLLLERILTRAGFTVEAFENGQLACDAIQREAPDVVLLDWMMPVMDGPATVKYLKAQPDTRGIPVVMLTIHAEIEDRVAAFETGVQDFLMKPFDARELVARIEQQMRWRGVLASDAPAGPRLECVRPIETDYTMTP
jgi:CheY-like chemotaxis protein